MHFFYAERLEEKQSLTSSWPKELKLQPIENEKFDDEDDLDDDEDDYDEEEYEYDDEDDYDDEDYDDEYYDEEFYENEVIKVAFICDLFSRSAHFCVNLDVKHLKW